MRRNSAEVLIARDLRLLDVISDMPGLTTNELSSVTGMAQDQVRGHVRVLCMAGLAETRYLEGGKGRAVYPRAEDF